MVGDTQNFRKAIFPSPKKHKKPTSGVYPLLMEMLNVAS